MTMSYELPACLAGTDTDGCLRNPLLRATTPLNRRDRAPPVLVPEPCLRPPLLQAWPNAMLTQREEKLPPSVLGLHTPALATHLRNYTTPRGSKRLETALVDNGPTSLQQEDDNVLSLPRTRGT